MRIGFDGTPLLGPRTGVGQHTGHLLTALTQVRPAWEYLLFSNRPLTGLEPALAALPQVRGPLPRSRWLWLHLALARQVARHDLDLCHFTNASAPLGLRRPYVLTIHDASLFLYRHFHPWSRLIAIRLLLPLAARRAAAVITVSDQAKKDLVRLLPLAPDRVHVIPNGVPPAFRPVIDRQERQRVRTQYGLAPRFILYVGALEPRKNLARLVGAFRALHRHDPELQLVLVGPPGWLLNGFIAGLADLANQNAVRTLGYVPQTDLPALFSLAQVFAFPSLYEGFGLPALEAMACGTPVLTSQDSPMAAICGDAAVLVNPHDENAIEAGLHELLGDEGARNERRHLGLDRARAYTWHSAAQATAAVYERVLARQPAPDYAGA